MFLANSTANKETFRFQNTPGFRDSVSMSGGSSLGLGRTDDEHAAGLLRNCFHLPNPRFNGLNPYWRKQFHHASDLIGPFLLRKAQTTVWIFIYPPRFIHTCMMWEHTHMIHIWPHIGLQTPPTVTICIGFIETTLAKFETRSHKVMRAGAICYNML